MKIPCEGWQRICDSELVKSQYMYRTRVLGGWLVLDNTFDHTVMVFVPDRYHEWEIESI